MSKSELKKKLYDYTSYSKWSEVATDDSLIEKMNTDIANNNTSDYNFEDKGGNNFIDISIIYRRPKLAIELIKTGLFDLGHKNKEGHTTLMHACFHGSKDEVLALLESGQSKPEVGDNNGFTALMWSLNREHNVGTEIALELIKSGQSNPGAVETLMNSTALIIACSLNFEDVAIALIKTGKVNINHKNKYGKNALFYAKEKGLNKVVTLLEDNGIDFDDIRRKFAERRNFIPHHNDDDTHHNDDDTHHNDDDTHHNDPDADNVDFKGGKQKKVRRTRKNKKITKRKNYRKKSSSVKRRKSKK
jgi:ankyrin repeat protein